MTLFFLYKFDAALSRLGMHTHDVEWRRSRIREEGGVAVVLLLVLVLE